MPHNYGENISLLAALGLAGLSAPMTVEGAVDAAVFRTYVEQVLGPVNNHPKVTPIYQLKFPPPG